jgi:hypothetical protein
MTRTCRLPCCPFISPLWSTSTTPLFAVDTLDCAGAEARVRVSAVKSNHDIYVYDFMMMGTDDDDDDDAVPVPVLVRAEGVG